MLSKNFFNSPGFDLASLLSGLLQIFQTQMLVFLTGATCCVLNDSTNLSTRIPVSSDLTFAVVEVDANGVVVVNAAY